MMAVNKLSFQDSIGNEIYIRKESRGFVIRLLKEGAYITDIQAKMLMAYLSHHLKENESDE